MAVSAALLLIGHLFGTTMIDLFCWVAVCWIAARLLRGCDPRWWLALGAVLGIGMLNKSLLAVLPIALLVGVGIAGPRSVLTNRWFVIAVVMAVLMVTPNLLWQNANGWPQVTLSRAIAAGESGSSQPRWLFLPYQLVLISPILVPVWVIGLGRLFTATALVRFRCFGWAYAVLFLAFLAAAGKPYYLVGLYPVLLAAGAPVVVAWLRRRAPATRRITVIGALALSLIINATLMLPLLPVQAMAVSPIADVNYDGGETAGWPEFVWTVAGVVNNLPAGERDTVVLLTGNYGEPGAIDLFGPAAGLPPAYSGHNAFALWGPPPDVPGHGVVVAVGLTRQVLAQYFDSVTGPIGVGVPRAAHALVTNVATAVQVRVTNGSPLAGSHIDHAPFYAGIKRVVWWLWGTSHIDIA